MNRFTFKRQRYFNEFLVKNHLNRIFIFKRNRLRLTNNEIDKIIYEVINKHFEGLIKEEIIYFSGLPLITIKKSLKRLIEEKRDWKRKVFERKINKYARLYYSYLKSKRLRKFIINTQKEKEEIERKIKEMMK